jgi:hypothetical protein
VQTTPLASTIGQSRELTGGLSACHLLGFTLVMGAALVSNLRYLGVLLPERPIADVAVPAHRGIAAGLLVSVTTGLLLLAPRAPVAAENGTFQLKMALLVTAALFQFGARRFTASSGAEGGALVRASGAVGLLLWLSLAVTACVFILLE